MSEPQSWPTKRIFTTSAGIKIFSSDAADNALINEIWGQSEYKVPIQYLLDLPMSPLGYKNILDLGANRGYFSFYVAHHLRAHNQNYEISSFEGSPENYTELQYRINVQQADIEENILEYKGLIGKRSGTGKLLIQEEFHARNLVVPDNKKIVFHDGASASLRAVEIPYLDIEKHSITHPVVDLIKCDIEGSEEMFLENYPDLLKRTNLLAIEFHPNYCNVPRCLELIRDSGLANRIPLDRPGVELFTRP